MTAHLSGDMGIDDNNLICGRYQQGCKQPHGGAAAAHAHFRHFFAVNDRGSTHLNFKPAAVFDFELHPFAVGDVGDGSGNDKTVFSGQPIDTANMQHLGAVLFGFHHADFSFSHINSIALLTDGYIRVDFDNNGAVTQRNFRHDGDDVNTAPFSLYDMGRRFAVRIGGPGANGRNQGLADIGPGFGADNAFYIGVCVQPCEPDEFTRFVAVTLTGADVPGLNPAFDRTGIAFDSIRRHAFSGNYGITLANSHAHAAIRAPVIIDHRLFLDHFNSIHRAVAHTVSTSDAFVFVNIHSLFPAAIGQHSYYDLINRSVAVMEYWRTVRFQRDAPKIFSDTPVLHYSGTPAHKPKANLRNFTLRITPPQLREPLASSPAAGCCGFWKPQFHHPPAPWQQPARRRP